MSADRVGHSLTPLLEAAAERAAPERAHSFRRGDAGVRLACFDSFAGRTSLVSRVSTRSSSDPVPFRVGSVAGTADRGLSAREALGRPSLLRVAPLGAGSAERPKLPRGIVFRPVLLGSSHCLASHCSFSPGWQVQRARENPSFPSYPGSSKEWQRHET